MAAGYTTPVRGTGAGSQQQQRQGVAPLKTASLLARGGSGGSNGDENGYQSSFGGGGGSPLTRSSSALVNSNAAAAGGSNSPARGGAASAGPSPPTSPYLMSAAVVTSNNTPTHAASFLSSGANASGGRGGGGGAAAALAQGGAVGLWRAARDGHSPNNNTNSMLMGNAGAPQQRPSTQGGPVNRGGGVGGRLGGAVGSRSPSVGGRGAAGAGGNNNTSAPLLNMSLDAALMGGMLGMGGTPSPSPPSSPSPPNARGGTPQSPLAARRQTGGSFGPHGTRNSNTASSSTYRSLSANAASPMAAAVGRASGGGGGRAPQGNYLIPPLQLPTYRRRGTFPHDLIPEGEVLEAGGDAERADEEGAKSDPASPNTAGPSPSVPLFIDAQPSWVTVVFDLDETLCNNRLAGRAMLRNGCMELLQALAAVRDDPAANCFMEIVLWTASMECVARPVLERMDPDGSIFDHLIFRDRRWYQERSYTKDLKLLGRDLSHVVIIENSPMSVVLNRRHAILVKDFVGGGPVNYYYGGGPLNTKTSTGSPTDPSLHIVRRILCEWAAAVGSAALNSLAADHKAGRLRHDPAFTALPMPLGIVEFLRDSPDMTANNEVALGGAGGPSFSSPATMQGAPVRGMRGFGGVSPTAKSKAAAAGGGGWAPSSSYGARSTSAAPSTRRYTTR